MSLVQQNRILKAIIPLLIQNASAHRKPRWIPVAKSRIFKVPKRPVVPTEEQIELKRLNNNYNTQIRAIRKYYIMETSKEKLSLENTTSEMSMMQESKEWEHCVALNEQWNTQVAAERVERRKKEVEALEEKALAKVELKEQQMRERMEAINVEIRRQKELSATFITAETLDAAIDNALDNPIDYNFVIDMKGNKTIGRDTPVSMPQRSTESGRVSSKESDRASTNA